MDIQQTFAWIFGLLVLVSDLPVQGEVNLPITIRLRPVAEVTNPRIRLADIAEISGSLHERNDRLPTMDIAVLDASRTHSTIARSLIDVRLQLAGWDRHRYRLVGPPEIVVSWANPQSSAAVPVETNKRADQLWGRYRVPLASPNALTDIQVERTIRASLEEQFGLAAGDVQTRLLQPFVSALSVDITGDVSIEVIAPFEFPYGRSQLTVRLLDGERVIASRAALMDIRRRQRVLLTKKTLLRSDIVAPDDVSQEIRFVADRIDELDLTDVVGSALRRSVSRQQILRADDLESANERVAPEVIRPRDSVRLVAYRKGLRFVIPAAEALQAGRVGQLIRVRNIQSNRLLTGRVIARGEVEVPLD